MALMSSVRHWNGTGFVLSKSGYHLIEIDSGKRSQIGFGAHNRTVAHVV